MSNKNISGIITSGLTGNQIDTLIQSYKINSVERNINYMESMSFLLALQYSNSFFHSGLSNVFAE